MMILALRTEKPLAELYLYEDKKELGRLKWQAHRELSNTIHSQTKAILNKSSISMSDLEGIVCFEGPGSFTGLRIGLSVANTLAYAQDIPIIAVGGENWIQAGLKDLDEGKNDKIVTPEYGSPPNITKPKK